MIVTKIESMASLIHDAFPTLRHSLQQSHNKGLYYGFRDAILSRLVTIKLLKNPENFDCTIFSSESYRT